MKPFSQTKVMYSYLDLIPGCLLTTWSQFLLKNAFSFQFINILGVNKNVSQATIVSNYESSMRGAQGYHAAYLGHFLINGKKAAPPPKVQLNEHNIAKIESAILDAYKSTNTSRTLHPQVSFCQILFCFK